MLLKKTHHLIKKVKSSLDLIESLNADIDLLNADIDLLDAKNRELEDKIEEQKKKFDKDMSIVVSALNELYMIGFNNVMSNIKSDGNLYDYDNIYNDSIEDDEEEGH